MHLLKGNAKQYAKSLIQDEAVVVETGSGAAFNPKELELVFREMDKLKASENQAREEVLLL